MDTCPLCFLEISSSTLQDHVQMCLDSQDRLARETQEQMDAQYAASLAAGARALQDDADDEDHKAEVVDPEPIVDIDISEGPSLRKLIMQVKANQGLYYPKIATNPLTRARSLEEAASIKEPPLQYVFISTVRQLSTVSVLVPTLVGATIRVDDGDTEAIVGSFVTFLMALPHECRSLHFYSLGKDVARDPRFLAALSVCKIQNVLLDVDSWDNWDDLVKAIGNNRSIESAVFLDCKGSADGKLSLRNKRCLMWFDTDFEEGSFLSFPHSYGKAAPFQAFFCKEPLQTRDNIPLDGQLIAMSEINSGLTRDPEKNMRDIPPFGLFCFIHMMAFESDDVDPVLGYLSKELNFRVSSFSAQMHHDFTVMLAAMLRDSQMGANNAPTKKQCDVYSQITSFVERRWHFSPVYEVYRKFPLYVRIGLFQWLLVCKRKTINRDVAILVCSYIATRNGWR